jgi:hypothetical protein
VLSAGDQIQKMADQTGLSINQVQRLQYVAGQSGTSVESLVGAIQNLQQRLGDDSTGATGAMKKLGINMEAFNRLDSYAQMTALASAIKAVQDPTEQASLSAAVFGKTWKEILPAIKAGMVEVGNQAPVMADETVKALDRIGDALKGAQQQWTAWGGAAVVAIEKVGFFLGGGVGSNIMLKKFADENDPTGLLRALDQVKPVALKAGTGLRDLTMNAADLADVEAKLTAATKVSIAEHEQVARVMAQELTAGIRLREEKERQQALGSSWGMFQSMNISQTGGLSALLGRGKVALVPDLLPTGEDFTRYLAGVMPTAMRVAGSASGPSFGDAFFKNFGSTITRAIEGGGNVLKSIGSTLGGNLTQHIFGEGSGMAASITNHFSGALGSAFNAILPGIGALAGPLLSKLASLFGGLFGGPSATEQQGRGAADAFRDSLASTLDWQKQIEVHQLVAAGNSEKWATTVVAIREAYLKAGHSVQEALEATDRLWRAEKLGGGAVQQVIDEIVTAMHDTLPDAADAAGDALHKAFGDATDAASDFNQQLLNAINATRELAGLGPLAGAEGAATASEVADFLRRNPLDTGRLAGGALTNIPGFAFGTRDRFVDFGAGTTVQLHGKEKIVPEGTESTSGRLEEVLSRIERTLDRLPLAIRDSNSLRVSGRA